MKKTRVTIQFADIIKDYVKSESEKMGLSQSAFVTMCIAQYKQGQEVMEAVKVEQRLKVSEANT